MAKSRRDCLFHGHTPIFDGLDASDIPALYDSDIPAQQMNTRKTLHMPFFIRSTSWYKPTKEFVFDIVLLLIIALHSL